MIQYLRLLAQASDTQLDPICKILELKRPMETSNTAVYWLIITTSIGSIMSALLYLFQRCCGQFGGNIGNVCYQKCAKSLGIRQETFNQVTNLLSLPRIFQQLELETYKVIWNHDANAQTGDAVQHGWIPLPSKSFVLRFLSVCGVTHYVWIPFDIASITIVGPADAIAKLIDLSNEAATTRLTKEQLDTLREAFGIGDAWTTADKVATWWERRIVLFMLSAACIGLGFMWIPKVAAIIALVMAVGVACWSPRLQHLRGKMWRSGSTLCRRSRNRGIEDQMEVALVAQRHWDRVDSVEATAAVESDLRGLNVDALETPQEVITWQELSRSEPAQLYSILLARSFYYEVVKQTKVTPKLNECIVKFANEPSMYAVLSKPNFSHYLAERTDIPKNASLHICVHNPMIDPYLAEMYQNFQKGVERENLVMIILPPLENFDACLTSNALARTRTAKGTQYVTTLSDYETLLLEMTAGFMPKLVFIVPIDEATHTRHNRSPFQMWVSSERALGSENCHWPAVVEP